MNKFDLNDLDDGQVKELINELKYTDSYINESELKTLIATKIKQRQKVISFKLGVKYIVIINRGNVEIDRFSISIIFEETYHTLVRIDIRGGIHFNPYGSSAPNSHIHIYNNAYEKKDRFAYEINLKDFPILNDIYSVYKSFLAYNNISETK